jgi:hypothetical protein
MKSSVARIERSDIRDRPMGVRRAPDFANAQSGLLADLRIGLETAQ